VPSEELKAEIEGARSRGVPVPHLAAVSPHFARLNRGEVETIAAELVRYFPAAGDGDVGLAHNAARMVDRMTRDRPVPAQPAGTTPLVDWPARPDLPGQTALVHDPIAPLPIPEVNRRWMEAEHEAAQRGWGSWGLKGRPR
jgi:hypothetical protein